jgi:CXXX repeat peptide maturase
MLTESYKEGQSIELNFITDRLNLHKMKNCDAGIKHITIAPNGKFYICPGFYFDNEDDYIGDLSNGPNIKNQHLLNLDYSPICRICDAYHCKRCIYLNNKTTLELNTPSHQQCVLSHIERNSTINLLDLLDPKANSVSESISIPHINYLDPIDILEEKKKERINLYLRERENSNSIKSAE